MTKIPTIRKIVKRWKGTKNFHTIMQACEQAVGGDPARQEVWLRQFRYEVRTYFGDPLIFQNGAGVFPSEYGDENDPPPVPDAIYTNISEWDVDKLYADIEDKLDELEKLKSLPDIASEPQKSQTEKDRIFALLDTLRDNPTYELTDAEHDLLESKNFTANKTKYMNAHTLKDRYPEALRELKSNQILPFDKFYAIVHAPQHQRWREWLRASFKHYVQQKIKKETVSNIELNYEAEIFRIYP